MMTLGQIELNLGCVLNTHCQEAKTEKKNVNTHHISLYVFWNSNKQNKLQNICKI